MKESVAPVTVIIPCFNMADTLAEAIESVLAQTAPPLEVLLIDDKSTDRSVAVASGFEPRVRVLRNPSKGQGAARRFGVTEARGTYIAFVDADDAIEPTKHEKQLAILENSDPYTLVHTGSVAFWPDQSRPDLVRTGGERATGCCTQVVFESNPICGASTMMRRSVISELGNYDPDLIGTEDFGMSLVASTRCDFVYLPEPLYRMRRHTGNITNRKAHMAYHHWLAQERFRRKCPDAFAQLPAESVQQYMIEPILRTVKEAYWQRESDGYQRLLRLALALAFEDTEIQKLWRRRRVPMWALRAWDRLSRSVSHKRPFSPVACDG